VCLIPMYNKKTIDENRANNSGEERLPYSNSSGPVVRKCNHVAAVVASTLGFTLPYCLMTIISAYCDNQEYYKVVVDYGIDMANIPLYMAPVLDYFYCGKKQPVPSLKLNYAPRLISVLTLRGCLEPSPALLDFFKSGGPFPVGCRVFQSATNERMQIQCFRVGETIELTVDDGPMFSCPLGAMWWWHAGCPSMYNPATSERAYNNFRDPLPDHELLVRGMRSRVNGVLLDDTPYDTMFVHEFTDSPANNMKPSYTYNKAESGFYEPFRRGVGQLTSDHLYSCVIKWVGIIDACFAETADCPYRGFGPTDYFRLVVLSSSVKKR
jgi:hypothetical protein